MFIRVNGINLYYEKYGSGPPVIFLHGNGESVEIYKDIPELLPEHTVYLIDSRNHGKSDKTSEISYDLIKNDIRLFIQELHIEKPVICGFSDGGIVGLLLAIEYPFLLEKLILCGPNINPKGMKLRVRFALRMLYIFQRNPLVKMMLKEPNIALEELQKIRIPTLILGGKNDIISRKHLSLIHANIPGSELLVLPKENHFSYVFDNVKLINLVKNHL